MKKFLFLFCSLLIVLATSLSAQQRSYKSEPPLRTLNSSEIQEALRTAQVLGSVLYVAAHPDDENTRLITYLARGRGYQTTYLSMTRGDGGQNSLGPETGAKLGMVRTQELLAARNIDGGHQRFTRAIDFGYSKDHEETLEIWNKDMVLGDIVRTIRQLQPDVIITRFPGPEDGGGGHGHHTSSFILAREAFDLSGDPAAYPAQLIGGVRPWQVSRLYWNNWKPYWGGEYDPEALLEFNIGEYNPVLGMSYGEIADLAASQHRCQDWGRLRIRGPRPDYLELKAGEEVEGDFFTGIDATWSRVPGGEKVGQLLARAEQEFHPTDPSAIVPLLLDAYRELEKLPQDNLWVRVKGKEIQNLIIQCTGLWMEAISKEPTVCLGDSLALTSSVIKRSDFPVVCKSIRYFQNFDSKLGNGVFQEGTDPQVADFSSEVLGNNAEPLSDKRTVALPNTLKAPKIVPTQPYWLTQAAELGTYNVNVRDEKLIGMPETPSPFHASFEFSFGEENPISFSYTLPVVYKYADRNVGELYRPLLIVPKVTVNLSDQVYLFGDDQPQQVSLLLTSHSSQPLKTTLRLKLPEGWEGPTLLDVSFSKKGEEVPLKLEIIPPSGQSVGALIAEVQVEGDDSPISYGMEVIEYEHFPIQMMFPAAEAKLVRIGLEKRGEKIGYIMGPEDAVPACLSQVGYQVSLLSDGEITQENLRQYDAVVAGARVYSARDRMPNLQEQVLEYVREGGTYVMQYNKTYELGKNNPGPYPMKVGGGGGRDRVTREDAPVTVLMPDHPAFNSPNKITEADFEDWIQERGLYFPSEWDPRYEALTECHDPGEDPKRGALLVAKYGEGYFVYTSFAFFRELPAGVPGAYRLFANLLSLGK